MSGGINFSYINAYTGSFMSLVNNIIVPVLLTIAFAAFVFGVFRYFILGADDPSKRASGGQFVLWSVVGFVLIFSLWGLVDILGTTLGLHSGVAAPPPPSL